MKFRTAFVESANQYAGGPVSALPGLLGGAAITLSVAKIGGPAAVILGITVFALAFILIVLAVSVFKLRPTINRVHALVGTVVGTVILLTAIVFSNQSRIASLASQLDASNLAATEQALQLSNARETATEQAERLASAYATQTAEARVLVDVLMTATAQDLLVITLQAKIEPQASQSAAASAEPPITNISDLPTCDFEVGDYPCKHWTEPGDEFAARVAVRAYGNAGEAGRIAELYRDENGGIPAFEYDRLILVPDNSLESNEEYYEFYFRILQHPIFECSGPVFSFPCWRVSDGESYEVLARSYPLTIDPECIKAANKTEWSSVGARLDPKEPELGSVFVLPNCPALGQ